MHRQPGIEGQAVRPYAKAIEESRRLFDELFDLPETMKTGSKGSGQATVPKA